MYGAGVNGGLGSPGIGDCTSEVSVVNTALSYLQAHDLALAAEALGDSSDAAHYTALAGRHRDRVQRHVPQRRSTTATATAGRPRASCPLAFGMVPAADLDAVGDQLVHTILVTDNGHLDTGIFGTRYLMDALSAIGRTDVADDRAGPDQLSGIRLRDRKGATTDWEQWTYASDMESHDHAMFGGINASLVHRPRGYRPRPRPATPRSASRPRYRPDCGTSRRRSRPCAAPCPRSWTNTGRSFQLDVSVPVNATATVRVPLLGRTAGAIRATPGAVLMGVRNGFADYQVGSGHWHFTH